MCYFIGNNEDCLRPTLVSALKGVNIVDISLGTRDSQTLAVSDLGILNKENYIFFSL